MLAFRRQLVGALKKERQNTMNNAPSTTPRPAAASRALALAGSFDDVSTINARLREAAEKFHLISPATTCPQIPPGCVVSTSIVAIDPATDTHDVGGKRALIGYALFKLANAAGICWSPSASGRVDDGRDPRVVVFHAEGVWRDLSGAWLPVVGDCQMDLRDGSAQVEKILESAKARTNNDGSVRMSAAEVGRVQLRDTRAKILEHAQTKAKLRGIRSALAIRSYTAAELAQKPFVVARLSWVGTDSPDDRAAIRDSFLRGSAAAFGIPTPTRQLAPVPVMRSLPARSVSPDGEVLHDFLDEPLGTDSPPHIAEPAEASPAPAPTTAQPAPAAAPSTETPARSGHVIPGGSSKNTPIEDASDRDLEYWAARLEKALADGTSRSRERDEDIARAMRAELAARAAT